MWGGGVDLVLKLQRIATSGNNEEGCIMVFDVGFQNTNYCCGGGWGDNKII